MSVQSFQWCRLAKLSAPMIHTKRPRLSTGAKRGKRCGRGAGAETALEIGDDEARMMRRCVARCGEALFIVAIIVGVLQGVLRRDEPPDPVEIEALQRIERHGAVAAMGRIERAAEQADALAVAEWRDHDGRMIVIGRVCPVPRDLVFEGGELLEADRPPRMQPPVAMPISAPKPNSPPSANCVEALWSTMALSTSARKRSARLRSSVTIASVCCEP